ncbi:DNA-directed DNA polymerase [Methanoregula formicica]|uniref:DNA polymerase n=1 Tax=Methanoregula formicica (strain DSM 22288 / NBRC 105244 / SMSP) TaxID=593750 RepID=L0HHE1_METFS|nr:DNA-directed DNA polymerase [Methanoregula formicica]AGB03171.1 DNA polymerase elongation subunit (family B) [Methanoregula formicica SMSP]
MASQSTGSCLDAACTLDSYSRDIRIAINQVEYSNSPGGPVIHIFGRDTRGKAVRLDVTGFRPYFYVPADQAESTPIPPQATLETGNTYRSIRGEQLRRLFTQRPTDVRDVRERYRHFEADIPFATRFMIDTGLTGGVAAPKENIDWQEITPIAIDAPARTCIIDIECEDERGFPDPQRDAIICITCYDSFDEDYTTFLFSGSQIPAAVAVKVKEGGLDNGCFREGTHTICSYADEPAMLRAFTAYIIARDPDILSGWNFVDFDMPYITGRMERLGLKSDSLARIPGMTERNALRGRALFDLLTAYKKMHSTLKESYRLDAIAMDELGQQKVRYTGTISDLWKKEPALLVEYNFKDVELCVGINKKDNIIGFYREIARYVGCPLDKTLNSSSVIDVYVLRKAFGNYVLPSKGFANAEEFEGATVFEPSKGVRENVVVLDLKSLYPMAMMTINASMETKDPAGELRAPNGIRFRKQPNGLTRSIIADLLKERDEKKRLRNTFAFGSPEYIMYDMQQNVLKVIMNTYYGVSGYTRFRLFDREIGAAVTSVGRAIIEHTRREIEKMGYTVIYGDTDSCMIQLPPLDREKTIEIARSIEKQLNASYPVFAKTELNADVSFFSIKFEKIYARFFQAGKKKRYAGSLVWKEGKDVQETDIVGFEIKRSDTPQITKHVQKTVMELILDGKGLDEVKAFLGEVIKKYRAGKYTLDEIGIPGGIGKSLDDYETDDAQVRGAKYANQYLHTEFGKGSKPKRIYIKTVTAKYPKTDVLCFEYADQVPPEFVVDLELMLEKTIRQPISRIIEALGWSWADVDPSRTTLAQWGLG